MSFFTDAKKENKQKPSTDPNVILALDNSGSTNYVRTWDPEVIRTFTVFTEPDISDKVAECKTLEATLRAKLLEILSEFGKCHDTRSPEYRMLLRTLCEYYEQFLDVEKNLQKLGEREKNPFRGISLQPIKPSTKVTIGAMGLDRKTEMKNRVEDGNKKSLKTLITECSLGLSGDLVIIPPPTEKTNSDLVRAFESARHIPSIAAEVSMHLYKGRVDPQCLGFPSDSTVLPVLNTKCLYDSKGVGECILRFFPEEIGDIISGYIQPRLDDYDPDDLPYTEPSHHVAVADLDEQPLLKLFRTVRVHWRGKLGKMFGLQPGDRDVPLTLLYILAHMPYTVARYRLENIFLAILQEPYPNNQFSLIYDGVMDYAGGQRVTNPEGFKKCLTFASVFLPKEALSMLKLGIENDLESSKTRESSTFDKIVKQKGIEIEHIKGFLSNASTALGDRKRFDEERKYAVNNNVDQSIVATNPFDGKPGLRTECLMNDNVPKDIAVTSPNYLTDDKYMALTPEKQDMYRHLSEKERDTIVANLVGFLMGHHTYTGGTFEQREREVKGIYREIVWIRQNSPPSPTKNLSELSYAQKCEIEIKELYLYDTKQLEESVQDALKCLKDAGRSERSIHKEYHQQHDKIRKQHKEYVRRVPNIHAMLSTAFPSLLERYSWLQNFSESISRKSFVEFRKGVILLVAAYANELGDVPDTKSH